MRVAAALTLFALAACGGRSADTDSGPARDIRLDQASSAGTQAMAMDLPGVAVRQYTVALARARERDDSAAIADAAYNLALAQMLAGDPQAAVATARTAQAELERRHATVPAELALARAAAAYRAGDRADAAAAAQQALGAQATDPDTVPRAWFIRGLVAADNGDRALLAQAIAALGPAKATSKGPAKSADLEADREELEGRAAMLDGQAASALASFEQAAANRQQAIDYRGMTRSLALAGDASVMLDRKADAAGFFLRAGRSALLRGDDGVAMPLLKKAEDLARQSSQTGIADDVVRLRAEALARRATR